MKEKPIQLYEVIRVIDNTPLFLEDHLERFYRTAELNNLSQIPDYQFVHEKIINLITDENPKMGNLKLTFTIKANENLSELDLIFIPHFYPSEEKYVTGVKVGILHAERPNPQAKIQNMELRNKANLIMSKENVFEVLLIDNEKNISEGSRSNIFFVKGDQLFTPPDEKVLRGITRKKILQLCESHQMPVIKKDIPFTEIPDFEGAFLTGSSPKVLPIYSLNRINFNPGLPLIKKIIRLYDQEINEYLEKHKSY